MKPSTYVKTGVVSSVIYVTVAFSLIGMCGVAQFAKAEAPEAPNTVYKVALLNLPSGDFVKKKKSIKGSWSVVQENGQTIIRFAGNFKTKNGPDLKIFLSPKTIKAVNGKTATAGSVNLGVLKSTSGTQDYIVPSGVNLADFNSVLVHCEAYSILWGGGAL